MDVSPTPTPLSSMPIDIVSSICQWIPRRSVDACLLRQTNSSMKMILTEHLGWPSLVDARVPLTHELSVVMRCLPKPSLNNIERLKRNALKRGQFENFAWLHDGEKVLAKHVVLPIKNGHFNCVKQLLYICDADLLESACDEVLLDSASYGDMQMFAHAASLRQSEHPISDEAVVEACKYGHLEMVKYLHVTMGLDIHTEKELPLLFASGNGYLDIVNYLVSQCCVIRSEDDRAWIRAAQFGHLDVVKRLYTSDIPVYNIRKAFVLAASYNHLNVLKYLQSLTAIDDKARDTAFVETFQGGHEECLEVIKILHSMGTDIRMKDDLALKIASGAGWLEIVDFLCSVGANVHAQDGEAIRSATKCGHLAVVKLLHSYGADVCCKHHTPILLASEHGYLSIVKFLHINGTADIHSAYAYDLSVRKAAENGHAEVVRYLHSVGANIYEWDNSALQSACVKGHLATVKCLYSAGADIHYQYEQALRSACRNDQWEVAMFLFSVGADVHLALQYAKKNVLDYKTLAKFVEFVTNETANPELECQYN